MKFIFLAMLSILVSCSQESSKVDINRIADRNNDENIIVLAELNVTNSATGIIGLSDQQLGSLEQGVTIVQDLFIKNTTASAVNFNASANDANVTLDKTFCTAAATRGTCKFVATIKASQTLGQQISSITINGQTLNYVLNVIPKVVPLPALSYPNPMDVGITQSAAISKSFTVINQSMNTLAYVIDSSQTNSQFSITSNCPSVDRNRGCPVSITFTPTQPLVAGMVTSNFKLNGVTINIQATVDAPTTLPPVTPPVNPWDFGDIEQGKAKTISISITNRTGISDTGPLSVTGLTNFSNPIITCPTSWDRNRTCKITLTFNATGKNVQEYLETLTLKGSKIQLDLNLRANVIFPSGIVPCTLANSPSYGVNINNVSTVSGNIPLCQVSTCTDSNLYEVSPDQLSCIDKAIPCQLSDVQANGWNTSNQLTISGMKIGSDVSQCVVQSCITNYSVNSSLKSCEADACTMLNASSFGVNLLNVDSVSGTTPNCIVSTCSNPSLYEVSPDQKSCVDKPLACTLSDAQSNGWNISNAQSPDGLKVGTNVSQCSVSLCLPNYQVALLTKTCDPIITPCTQADAILNGVNISNVNTSAIPVYLGNVVAGNTSQCLINSCMAGYSKAADSKSCNIITRSCIASDITSLGGTITNALTYSGTVLGLDASACRIATCSGTFEPATNGLSCENKAMTNLTFTITNKNANGYVKDSFLQLAINTVNALEMKISDSTNCSGGTWEAFSSSKQFTIPAGRLNGTVDAPVSIQFRRNATTSSCIYVSGAISLATSHLYRHDNIAPTPLTITTYTENQNITANSITFSGACFTGVNRETGLAGQTLTSAACSGSAYTSQSISTATDGIYSLYVRQIDLAGNLSEVTRNVRKITNCSLANATSGGVRSTYGAIAVTGNLTDGCTITSCQTYTTLAGDAKECVPKDITSGSFLISNKNANGFVNTSTVTLSSISATNAQTFDIFENDTCTAPAKVSDRTMIASTSFTPSTYNHSIDQSVSILFKNGSKTLCAHVAGAITVPSANTYRHDNTAPSPLSLTTTLTTNGGIITTTVTSVIFTGTCDSAWPLYVGLLGGETLTTCTSGTYSKTISSTFATDGTYNFKAYQTDSAGNTAQQTYTIIRDTKKFINVTKLGAGNGTVTSNTGGISCPGTCSVKYAPGTVVTLTATPDSVSSTFSGWSVTNASSTTCTGTTSPCSVTVGSTNDVTVQATFALKPTYALTVSKTGAGSGTVSSTSAAGISCGVDCAENYYQNQSVTLSAVADANSVFVSWSGACTGSSTTCVVAMGTAAKTVTANFRLKLNYTLTVTKSGDGVGTVSSSPSGINCGSTCSYSFLEGTVVNLTTTPDTYSLNGDWGGSCAGVLAADNCEIVIDSAKTVSKAYTAMPVSPTDVGSIVVTDFNNQVFAVRGKTKTRLDDVGGLFYNKLTSTEINNGYYWDNYYRLSSTEFFIQKVSGPGTNNKIQTPYVVNTSTGTFTTIYNSTTLTMTPVRFIGEVNGYVYLLYAYYSSTSGNNTYYLYYLNKTTKEFAYVIGGYSNINDCRVVGTGGVLCAFTSASTTTNSNPSAIFITGNTYTTLSNLYPTKWANTFNHSLLYNMMNSRTNTEPGVGSKYSGVIHTYNNKAYIVSNFGEGKIINQNGTFTSFQAPNWAASGPGDNGVMYKNYLIYQVGTNLQYIDMDNPSTSTVISTSVGLSYYREVDHITDTLKINDNAMISNLTNSLATKSITVNTGTSAYSVNMSSLCIANKWGWNPYHCFQYKYNMYYDSGSGQYTMYNDPFGYILSQYSDDFFVGFKYNMTFIGFVYDYGTSPFYYVLGSYDESTKKVNLVLKGKTNVGTFMMEDGPPLNDHTP